MNNVILDEIIKRHNLNVKEIEFYNSHDNEVYRVNEVCVKIAKHSKYNAIMLKQLELLPYIKLKNISIPQILYVDSVDELNYMLCNWIDGNVLSIEKLQSRQKFIDGLCDFYNCLYGINVPQILINKYPNTDNFFRGDHISVYRNDFYNRLNKNNLIDERIVSAFEEGCNTVYNLHPKFVHGDLFPSNILINKDNNLNAVIDFGTMGIGDPSCDFMMLWWYFSIDEIKYFISKLKQFNIDDFLRGRSWALLKALANGNLELLDVVLNKKL